MKLIPKKKGEDALGSFSVLEPFVQHFRNTYKDSYCSLRSIQHRIKCTADTIQEKHTPLLPSRRNNPPHTSSADPKHPTFLPSIPPPTLPILPHLTLFQTASNSKRTMSRRARAPSERETTPPPLTVEEQLATFEISDAYRADNIVGEGAYGLVW